MTMNEETGGNDTAATTWSPRSRDEEEFFMATRRTGQQGTGPGGVGGGIKCPHNCGNSFATEQNKIVHVNTTHPGVGAGVRR